MGCSWLARKWAESSDDSPELTADNFKELLCPEDFREPTPGIASEFFHHFPKFPS